MRIALLSLVLPGVLWLTACDGPKPIDTDPILTNTGATNTGTPTTGTGTPTTGTGTPTGTVTIPEICDNGVDDDGDGVDD